MQYILLIYFLGVIISFLIFYSFAKNGDALSRENSIEIILLVAFTALFFPIFWYFAITGGKKEE